MHLIKTKSFELAVYARGDENSPKLAIVIPGRLDTKDYIHLTGHVDHLANLGYYALSFDPAGTWESPGGIELYTTTNILQEINELIAHFGDKPTVLLGHSRGGTAAMLVGVANPYVTHFAAIMSYHGPSNVGLPGEKGAAKLSLRDMPPGSARTKEQKQFELPYAYFEDQRQYDALEGLKTCSKPKLFFYGTQDALVSKEDVEEMHALSAEPKQIHTLDSEHDYRLHPAIIEEVNQVIGTFLVS